MLGNEFRGDILRQMGRTDERHLRPILARDPSNLWMVRRNDQPVQQAAFHRGLHHVRDQGPPREQLDILQRDALRAPARMNHSEDALRINR